MRPRANDTHTVEVSEYVGVECSTFNGLSQRVRHLWHAVNWRTVSVLQTVLLQ